ncbi:MAG: carboxypeptidase-like regulatory domain-containing protein [Methanobrevibacter sp.]|nr:carboxypeptidase-like regulatory domain-containing protein [Candidatus Methanovirga procula]
MVLRVSPVFVVMLVLFGFFAGFCFADGKLGTYLWADDYNFDVSEDVIVYGYLVYNNESGGEFAFSGEHVVASIIDDGESRDSTTDSDGCVSFDFGKLNAGNYSVELVYPGNEIYDSVTKVISVSVVSSVTEGDQIPGDSSVFGGESVGLECTGFNLYVLLICLFALIACFVIRR